MLQELEKTLLAFLRAELPDDLREMSISFAAPDGSFPPAGVALPALSLFLSGMQENPDPPAASSPAPRTPEAWIDCYYVACAFSNVGTNPEEDEHRILGELMRVFFRFREIPAKALQGSFRDQTIPIRSSTLLPTAHESGVKIWDTLKTAPRASLHYVITVGVDAEYAAKLS